jgi:[ribosomal protein S5]-alanine N-acetyltransferase
VSIVLDSPSVKHTEEFLAAVKRSQKLHHPWVSAPATAREFAEYLERLQSPNRVGYFIRTETRDLAGVINISEIVRGSFLSGYLGYYAFVPHHNRGYMTLGLKAVLKEAFRELQLHRLEANIQPGNEGSRRLVKGLGFRLEGFSPRYLKIAGRWRDHERWALTVEDWALKNR